jgi:putative nucleotidyltransferase with HDIG domain
MDKDEIQIKIYSKIDELPTLPVVLPKLLSLMENEKSHTSDIIDTISHDPALTSKVLKVANSAYYGFQREISSLERAVVLLGFNMVRTLALSIGIIRNMPADKPNPYFSWEGLWMHSLAVATVMQELGRRFGRGDGSEYLFIIGLLHDVGKVVLDQFFSEPFRQALEDSCNQEKVELHVAERSVFGFDHGEIGAMLLSRWKFPEKITDCIAFHHQMEMPLGINGNDLAMLRIADVLPQELDIGEEGNPVVPEIRDTDLCKVSGMNREELEEMRTYLNGAKNGIHAFFKALH